MLLAELAESSRRVAAASGRREKIALLAAALAPLAPDEVPIVVPWFSGGLRQGRSGVAHALIEEALRLARAEVASLTVAEVDARLEHVTRARGAGVNRARREALGELFARATPGEGDFLARVLHGELRQGALEGVLVDAVALAARVPSERVRRALMLDGDLGRVARAALTGGAAALEGFGLRVLEPVLPMLAESVEDDDDALRQRGELAVEPKLDGARVQVHRLGGDVRVFTRQLNDVTARVPEVVEAALALPENDLVLDGEALALDPDGRPLPFQTTMRRLGRRLDVEASRAALPVRVFFFDCLRASGQTLLDRATADRFAALDALVPADHRLPRDIAAEPAEIRAALARALEAGHEGVMLKSLHAPYEAGRRGASWLKLKPSHTLDLVALAAEWGNGRRRGWLSNLHLGARDPRQGGFVMLGKTFKGMTDEMLRWQTEHLLGLEIGREGHVVHVRPELVVEVAFDGVQQSPQYPAGLALRFARLRRHRPDKRAEEADTIDAVAAFAHREALSGIEV